MINRRKENPINERTGIQNLMGQIIDAIQPSRSGISQNSLIKVDGEVAITYEVVQDYMASIINVAYVGKDSAEENLIVIRSTKIITAYMVDGNENVKCILHQSSSQYGGIRRGINHVSVF